MLDEALIWAAQCHAGQVRDGESPLPYFVHAVEVLMNLREIGGVTDHDMLVAAVLHDVREESGVSDLEIRTRFGDRVADLVAQLTRYEPSESEKTGLSKAGIWALRSKIMLREIAQMSPEAQKIKLADRLSNLVEAKQIRSPAKLARYVSQTLQILEIIPRSVNPQLWNAILALVKA